MSQQQTHALVLHVNDYNESDVIVTLYSNDIGKFKAIAKGAKRSRKRFVNKLEIFSHLLIQYVDKYALPIVEQAELLKSHITLRQNYKSYLCGQLICELVLNWTQEYDQDTELFQYIRWAFNSLSGNKNQEQFTVLFLAKFYKQQGYLPDFSCCTNCGKLDAQGSPFSFILSQGVISCRKCKQTVSVALSINTVKLLSKAFKLPLDKLSRLQFNQQSNIEAINFFKQFDRYLLDRELQSWNFIKF